MIQPRFRGLIRTVLKVVADVVRLTSLAACSHAHLAAENLFLRKHLALYLERQVRPRRADDATRITLVALSVTFYTVCVIDLASRRVQILGSTPHPEALSASPDQSQKNASTD